MITGNVVPCDTVFVNVIEDAHASFHTAVDFKFSVVWLSHFHSLVELGLVTGVGPGLVGPAGGSAVGGGHFHAGAGPEPPIDIDGLEIVTVTAFEVTQTSRGPNVGQFVYKNEGKITYLATWQ